MSLGSYFLRGVGDDHILVFRSDDAEDILRIITRLAASRDKEIKGLAQQLELQWFEREYTKDVNDNNTNGNLHGGSGPKDRQKNQDRSGN